MDTRPPVPDGRSMGNMTDTLRAAGPVLAAFAAGTLLAALLALTLVDVGSPGTESAVRDVLYCGILALAAACVLARAWTRSEQRAGWALIAAGLALWAVGESYYIVDPAGWEQLRYPSLGDLCFFAFYALAIAGVRKLGGRFTGRGLLSTGLVVSLLGLATIWSWLVFEDVLVTGSADTAAFATMLAYPLLDLVLFCSVMVALASRHWRLEGALIALALGFVLLTVVDSVYAVQSADGSYRAGTPQDVLWPASALLIAASAWMPWPRAGRDVHGDGVTFGITAGAIAAATGVLFWDHFGRLEDTPIVLACVTLLAGIGQLMLLQRQRNRAAAHAVAADSLRAASTSASPDCIVTVDAAGVVVEWNETARETFGYTREQAVGSELDRLIIPPSRRASHRDVMAQLADRDRDLGHELRTITAMRAGGELFPAEVAASRVQDDPPLYTGFLRDITETKRAELENERLAGIVRSTQDAIISTDVDGHIAAWNDGAEELYGYSSSDAIGRSLSALIAPVGKEEEFAHNTRTVLAGEPLAVETKRKRKNGQLVDVSLRANRILDMSGSAVGACVIARDITARCEREELLRADEEGALWRSRIEHALGAGEFAFFGQPVVDVITGAVHHKELLIRMDLDGEVITPNRFLPYAESCGLIGRIDRWAVERGIEHAAEAPVAINLSARSLGNRDLTEAIAGAFASSGASPRDVTFEITETAAAENLPGARELIHYLREIGCGIALDDFGTGFAPFIHLRTLEVTELKIDMQFVSGAVKNLADRQIIASMVSIAERFGMRTVAEGVEDEETLQVIHDLGVDLAQGYHFARPVRMAAPRGLEAAPC